MGECLFLAASHGYLLFMYLLLFVWQNKTSSSPPLRTSYWCGVTKHCTSCTGSAPAPNIGLPGTKKGSNRRVQSVNTYDASTSSQSM